MAAVLLAGSVFGIHKARLHFDRNYLARHLGEDWAVGLLRKGANANTVRFRTGGICHRDKEAEKEIFILDNTESISELLRNIKVDKPEDLAGCLCCGDVTIEFWRKKKLLTSVSIHHSSYLRWENNWPADAPLSHQSREYLANLLASNGYSTMRAAVNKEQLRRAATHKRWEIQKSLLPDGLKGPLLSSTTEVESIAILERFYPDETTRTQAYYRLLGCTRVTWGIASSFDSFLFIRAIRRLGPSVLVAALQNATNDEIIINGAGYALLREGAFEKFSQEQKETILSVIAPVSLKNAREDNRRATMMLLAGTGTDFARNCLRDALFERIEKETLPPDESEDPYGTIFYNASTYFEPTRYCDNDTTFAAYLLAALGDETVKAKIMTLLTEATEKQQNSDAQVLTQALSLLDNAMKSKKQGTPKEQTTVEAD